MNKKDMEDLNETIDCMETLTEAIYWDLNDTSSSTNLTRKDARENLIETMLRLVRGDK